jgi:hypothetical protein
VVDVAIAEADDTDDSLGISRNAGESRANASCSGIVGLLRELSLFPSVLLVFENVFEKSNAGRICSEMNPLTSAINTDRPDRVRTDRDGPSTCPAMEKSGGSDCNLVMLEDEVGVGTALDDDDRDIAEDADN